MQFNGKRSYSQLVLEPFFKVCYKVKTIINCIWICDWYHGLVLGLLQATQNPVKRRNLSTT